MTDTTVAAAAPPFDPADWPSFLTVPEVAKILRISKMTVYRMIHRGDFGPDGVIQAGRSFRVSSSALDGYLKSTRVNS
jgi:excisionase family DNA binding protein